MNAGTDHRGSAHVRAFAAEMQHDNLRKHCAPTHAVGLR